MYNELKMFDIKIIQPPMVQLNTPYPSGAYLSNFFKQNFDCNVKWFDFSNEIFHSIFSRNGLKLIFSKTEEKAIVLAEKFEKSGDENSAFQIRRFVSESENWINWIDKILSIVCQKANGKTDSGREFVHEFVRSAHSPRGMRIENFLMNLNRDVTVDDSQILATLALVDLKDYISTVYDNNFSLIQYDEKVSVNKSTFSDVEKDLNSPVLKDFYLPILEKNFNPDKNSKNQKIFLITVPFAGCFESAIFTGKFLKTMYGENCLICLGGGYINCELRNISEKRIFNYVDLLSFDKGFGSYKILFEKINSISENYSIQQKFENSANGNQFYKIRYFDKKTEKIIPQLENDSDLENFEHKIIKNLTPDFSDIDFSKYPKLADTINPMHRIWNDGSWLKIFMAYGCYWHKCSFCDTNLDYVKDYCCTDYNNFYEKIYEQSEKTGIYGIHFVDEACPPRALKEFALKNCKKNIENKKSLTFWGNIRFEKSFNRDFADLLSYSGLTAVSAGIEVATGNGLKSVNKGTDLETIVQACCAFKEAGILVHSYMIFGFWNQTEQDLINSMETLRQMFKNGLLDSAFFHKFSLTKNSTVYQEWKSGKIKDLIPIENEKNILAQNEISFKGEQKSQKYSNGLNFAVEDWMNGKNLNKNVESYFDFKMPVPSIQKNFIENLIEKYENNRDKNYNFFTEDVENCKKEYVWLGGKPLIQKNKNSSKIFWTYMGELNSVKVAKNAEKIAEFLQNIKAGNKSSTFSEAISVLGKNLFLTLRKTGLCCIN